MRKLFFGTLLSIFPFDWSGWIFDQRCSVNLIMRSIPLRIVLLQESTIVRYHERITVRSYKAVYSIWVDWLYYKWSFSFGLNFFFVLCVITIGLLTSKIRLLFLKIHLSDFLIEGSGNPSLIKFDLLLSLQTFVVQIFKLLKSQSMLLLGCHLHCQSNAQRWNLNFQREYDFTSVHHGNGIAFVGVLTVVQ